MATDERENFDKNVKGSDEKPKEEKLFTLKKWNAVAMWSWDVECDTCAICRVQVMGIELLKSDSF